MKSIAELLEAYPLPEQKEVPPYKIYCDMDGVLTDFEERFEHFAGMNPQAYEAQYGTAAFWELIDQKIGVRFWVGMKWMPGGQELWNFIRKYNPSILSSPSKDNTSRLGKNLWVRNNIPGTKLIFAYSKDKQNYANENAILIDDKKSNIEEWEAAGGIGIRCLYGNITPVLEKLKELGYE